MRNISEYVSLGHPDKIADYISQYLLDKFVAEDPNVRYAVEVQIKDRRVTLGGEVSSRVSFAPTLLEQYVREAVNDIGYTREYQQRWGAENTICGDELEVECLLSQQSPDIAQGTASGAGWGDQGIYWGYATPLREFGDMPLDHSLAKRLCKELFESGLGGLDIKTQVTVEDGAVTKVIVAIPLPEKGYKASLRAVRRFVRQRMQRWGRRYELIVNGTGTYVRHSSLADCGTTGRKLVVDFYGGNARIGGGSPWTKDCSKADLSLNLVARFLARQWAEALDVPCTALIASCIGQRDVEVSVRDSVDNILYEQTVRDLTPDTVRRTFRLDLPVYASMCRWGLFGEFQRDKAWEAAIPEETLRLLRGVNFGNIE